MNIDQQRLLHGQSQRRHRLRLILARDQLKLELGRNHHNNRQGLKSSKRLTEADTGSSIEARELEGRLLANLGPGMTILCRVCVVLQGTLLNLVTVALEPALREEFGCLGTPNLPVTADGISREHDAVSALDFDTTGEDIVSNGGLEITGHWWVQAEGLEEDSVGVAHVLGQHLVCGSFIQLVDLLPNVLFDRGVLHHLVVHPAECLSSCITSSTIEKKISGDKMDE